jgi:flagellar protein FlaG
MDINVSQVGQNAVLPRIDVVQEAVKNDRGSQDSVTVSQQQTKDLSITAETNNQAVDKQDVNKQDINKQDINKQDVNKQDVNKQEKSIQDIAEVSAEQMKAAVLQLSEILQTNNRQLSFSVDEDSNKQVVKVTDVVTGEMIRQIPTEEVLKLSERLQDLQLDAGTVVGLLFNKKV